MIEFSAFWHKADENLRAAQLCFDNSFYNACANRAYYAMFHAAISILIIKGFPPTQKNIDHSWVQSVFARELIKRRKIIQSKFKNYLLDSQNIRNDADYRDMLISRKKANRQLIESTDFINAIKQEINHD